VVNEHILVVGGTGMLRGIVKHYVAEGHIVSVVSRTETDLNKMNEAYRDLPGEVHGLTTNYKDTVPFHSIVVDAMKKYGPISKAIAWIHSDADQAPYDLGYLLNEKSIGCSYIRVLGSSVEDPSLITSDRSFFQLNCPNIAYKEVVLGFIIENHHSRWLTHSEICNGILRADVSKKDRRIVGTVRPWSLKP
jgi:hypothetical protein